MDSRIGLEQTQSVQMFWSVVSWKVQYCTYKGPSSVLLPRHHIRIGQFDSGLAV